MAILWIHTTVISFSGKIKACTGTTLWAIRTVRSSTASLPHKNALVSIKALVHVVSELITLSESTRAQTSKTGPCKMRMPSTRRLGHMESTSGPRLSLIRPLAFTSSGSIISQTTIRHYKPMARQVIQLLHQPLLRDHSPSLMRVPLFQKEQLVMQKFLSTVTAQMHISCTMAGTTRTPSLLRC